MAYGFTPIAPTDPDCPVQGSLVPAPTAPPRPGAPTIKKHLQTSDCHETKTQTKVFDHAEFDSAVRCSSAPLCDGDKADAGISKVPHASCDAAGCITVSMHWLHLCMHSSH